MKVLYITDYRSEELQHWSGLGFNIRRSLELGGMEVETIGPLKFPVQIWLQDKIKRQFYKILQKNYLMGRNSSLAISYARQVQKKIFHSDADIIFSPGSIPVSFLDTRIPIVFWTDATFAGMVEYYPNYSNLCNETIRQGNAIDQSALTHCELALYSSQWAAQSAIQHYSVAPEKVEIVPFGANTQPDLAPEFIYEQIENRESSTCRLLFVGVDWIRKGGDVALQIAEQLHRKGIPVELSIVGKGPSRSIPKFVKQYGFLSRAVPEHNMLLNQLYSKAHFLLLPSRAEAYGLVLAEANAFGVPVLASETGGIPTIVKNGLNGQLFPLDADFEQYVNFVIQRISDHDQYRQLAYSTYDEYQNRLNWKTSGETVRALLETLI